MSLSAIFSTAEPYLNEIRKRLIRSAVIFLIIFLSILPFMDKLFNLLAFPLLAVLPNKQALIAIGILSPISVPLQLAFSAAIFLSTPFWFYQIWAFIAPALYLKEKKWLGILTAGSILCFIMGMAFAYFVVFPLIFYFFINTLPANVALMPDIQSYLHFCINLFWAFGLAFQLPIGMILLNWVGIMSLDQYKKARPYVVVLAFILGMLLTPPDVLSQICLAIPIYLLYEAGYGILKGFNR